MIQLYLFVFALLVAGNVYNVIPNTLWFDKVLHIVSGSFMAAIGLLFAKKWVPLSPVKIKSYIAFMYSLTVSLLWEVFEFIGDTLMSIVIPSYEFRLQTFHLSHTFWFFPQPFGLFDTMIDVTLGFIGALLYVLYYRYSNKK